MQIVAPAGNKSGLIASINGGADAVYLGMPNFGARSKAENFDRQAIKKAVDYAHLFGVKVFITLNTLIKDEEMEDALLTAEHARNVGVDAAIVQDIRFIKRLKTKLPNFVLHASTQMGIHNAEGAKALLDLGIKRAVLARETLPQDISEIKKTGIEIEYFVQGALCVCFSGNCYFSSLASSYSGNRGKCMQLCRKPYYFNGKRGYFLSAKDLCMYADLKRLESLGVDAIKIEGRMRSDEYAFIAPYVYKSDMETFKALHMLKSVFNRGDYCNGYLDDYGAFRVIYPQIQGNIGVCIGKIDKVKGKKIFVNGFTPDKNDGFKVLRNRAEVCGAHVENGVVIVDGACAAGDQLNRTVSGEIKALVEKSTRRVDLDVEVTINAGQYPNVILSAPVHTVTKGSMPAKAAKTHALTEEDIIRTFKKVGDAPITPHITVHTDGKSFMAVSELNELRRAAYSTIAANDYVVKRSDERYIGNSYNRFNGHGKILMVDSVDKLDKNILCKIDYLALNPADYAHFDIPDTDVPILLNLPVTMRGDDRRVIKSAIDRDGIYGVISNNLYTVKLTEKPILLGTGHNIIGNFDLPHITSFEADKSDSSAFIYAFGYAPLMTLCHCPYGKCINCSGKDMLKDEGGRTFALRRYKTAHCYWQLLNCVPNYQNKPKAGNLFFDCTACDRGEILDILNFRYSGNFTRGNMNKGLK